MKQRNQGYKLLLEAIREIVIPKFLGDGFVLHPLDKEDLRSEMKYREPFGSLRRECPEGEQVVDVQFYPDKQPKFTLDFVIAPKEGVTLPWGDHVKVNQIRTAEMSVFYRLYANSFASPFGFSFFSSVSKDAAIKIANDALIKSSEIEDFFSSRKIGKHIRESINWKE